MEGNPFAPPRTSDLDGGVAPGAGTGPAISEESVQELVATAPWTRALVTLTVVSIALGVVGAVVSMAKAGAAIEGMSAVAGLVIGTPISVVFIVILRRYTQHGRRLAEGARDAVEAIIESQQSYMKATGICTIIMIGVGVVATIAMVAVAASKLSL
jgi:hypothetical protein